MNNSNQENSQEINNSKRSIQKQQSPRNSSNQINLQPLNLGNKQQNIQNPLALRLYKRPITFKTNENQRFARSVSKERPSSPRQLQMQQRTLVPKITQQKKLEQIEKQGFPKTFKIQKIDRLIPSLKAQSPDGRIQQNKKSFGVQNQMKTINQLDKTWRNTQNSNKNFFQMTQGAGSPNSKIALNQSFQKSGQLPKINQKQNQSQGNNTFDYVQESQLQQTDMQQQNLNETFYSQASDKNEQKNNKKQKNILRAKDFINLIKTDPELKDEFCFLNRRTHPYDWEIVDYQNRNPNYYMTISSRGIQQYNDRDIRFMTMEEWERENKLYDKIIRIEFFKNYKIWKSFSVWKKLMRQNIIKACSKIIQKKLFFLDDSLRQPLIDIRQQTMNINQQNFFEDSEFQGPVQFPQFKEVLQNYRQKSILEFIQSRQREIQQMLEITCKKSLTKFKKVNNIGVEQQDDEDDIKLKLKKKLISKTRKLLQKKEMQMEQNEEKINFTQEATIRTHCRKLKNFIKLVDYIILDAKVDLVIQATSRLGNQLLEHNKAAAKDESIPYFRRQNTWIIVNVFQENGKPYFQPSKDVLNKLHDELIIKNIQALQQSHKIFLYIPELKEYSELEAEQSEMDEVTQELTNIIYRDAQFKQLSDFFQQQLEKAYDNIIVHAKSLEQPLKIHQEHQNLKDIQYESMDADSFEKALDKYKQEDEILKSIESVEPLGLYLFNCEPLKNEIQNSAQKSTKKIQDALPKINYARAQTFSKKVMQLYNRISFNPANLEQFVKFIEDVKFIEEAMDDLLLNSSSIQSLLYLCQQHRINFSDYEKTEINKCQNQMSSLRKRIDEIVANSENNMEKFRRDLEKMIPQLEIKVKDLEEKLQSSSVGRKTSDINVTCKLLDELGVEINNINKEKNDIKVFEEALQVGEVSDFDKLDSLLQRFQLMTILWNGKKEWRDNLEEWNKIHFLKIDVEKMEDVMSRCIKISQECQKEIEIGEVAIAFIRDVEKFQNMYSAILSLKDQHIGKRQWKEIKDLIFQDKTEKELKDMKIKDQSKIFEDLKDNQYTLQFFFDIGIDQYHEKLKDIAIQASKEGELISIMTEVEDFWRYAKIKVIQYKEKNEVYCLTNNEDTIQKLDDNLLTMNNLLGNKYVENIRNRVNLQLQQMSYLQILLDELQIHQKNWIYLEPILSSQYAQKNLIKESRLFMQSDFQWKKLMKNVKDFPQAKKWAEDWKTQATLKNLKTANKSFEKIKRQLDDFLERKKETFKRFFFLSNEELLTILSTVSSVSHLIPHLRKIFDNIVNLDLDQKENIQGIISAEGENFQLKNCTPKGEIEEWLLLIEECMQTQVKSLCQKAYNKYDQDETQHNQWVLDYPCQIVLIVDGIWWTKLTENFLNANNQQDLYTWYESTVVSIDDIIILIKGELTNLQRLSVVNLITQEVHFRDIVSDLVVQQADSSDDFYWQRQLRLYTFKEEIYAIQVNTYLDYGFEYTGSAPKLVITPLTDKCWLTMTQSLYLKKGAQISGPAGTGKSETIKDLARQLGRYCLVFNCSQQITVKMMEKMFIGLCFTGSWFCLDEFNRIELEVLSVIAQQILTIRQANIRGIQSFYFSGRLLKLNPNIGIFTTMNPDYIGRSQIPDNLKILFRPVSMMVPDYAMIGEIMLFAEGFQEAQNLSKKLTKMYKLCTEQLSYQDHYDFGMRAVKQVLNMAGAMKRKENSESTNNETQILIKACRNTNLPKLMKEDIPLFNTILQDLFPNAQFPLITNKDLEACIISYMKESNLFQNQVQIEKILQLYETLQVRHSVMIIGKSLSGKSTINNILQNAQNILKRNSTTKRPGVISSIINPRAISMGELYGWVDPETGNFIDGLASQKIREFVLDSNKSKDEQWMIFDGPVDSLWAENLNTVLDESLTLCLSNGERIKIKQNMKIIFEALDLSNASLATVSRCGIIYLNENSVNYENVMQRVIFQVLGFIKNTHIKAFIIEQVVQGTPKFIQFLSENRLQLPLTNINIVFQIVKILKVILSTELQILDMEIDDQHQFWKKTLEKVIIFSFFWSVSTIVPQNIFGRFERYLWDIFSLEPVKGSLSNFHFVPNKHGSEFIKWDLLLEGYKYSNQNSFQDIFVSTRESVCYSWFFKKFLKSSEPIIMSGQTGTGKTIIVKTVIRELQEETKIHKALDLAFSQSTQSEDTQFEIENNLENHRKQGKKVLMPTPGKKLIIFIDDINLPKEDIYGTKSVLELVRFIQEHQGLYDRKTKVYKSLESVCMCAAAGSSQNISPNLLRYFTQVQIQQTSEESLHLIYSSILKGFLQTQIFKQEVKEFGEKGNVVASTLQVYDMISQQLLPVPSKQHYQFSLRDVSRVFQGILRAQPQCIQFHEQLARLWIHEIVCIFYDRLINLEDQNWFITSLIDIITQNFKFEISKEEILGNNQSKKPILFIPFGKSQMYEEVTDHKDLQNILQQKINESDKKIQLILFTQMIEIIVKITRVISLDRGHFMLIGITGTGKKAMTQLASCLLDYNFKLLPQTNSRAEFRKDFFQIMKKPGFEDEHVTFYIEDNGNKNNNLFYEDLNCFLHRGEVPNMLDKEDYEEINVKIQENNKQRNFVSSKSPKEQFYSNVLQKLHLVLGFSPVGPDFKKVLRNFRNFIKHTTMKWIFDWPKEALLHISTQFIEQNLFFEGVDQVIKQKISSFCVFIHESAIEMSQDYKNTWKRNVYITPQNYQEFLKTYIYLLDKKHKDISFQKEKLVKGVDKIHYAKEMITDLQEKLKQLQPQLLQKTQETTELIQKLEIDKHEASIVQRGVEEEERSVTEKNAFVEEKSQEAEKILTEAKPQLKIASEALNTLNRHDISEIKQTQNPHPLVKFTMECVAMLLEENTTWESIKKLISDTHFLQKMKAINTIKVLSKINPKVVQLLRQKIQMQPEFKPKTIKSINLACKSMCEWVLAVLNVIDVYNQIQDKKGKVSELKEELKKTQDIVQQKKTELQFQIQKVKDLETKYTESLQSKQQLSEDIVITEKRVNQATQLLSGLADEQIRWQEQVQEYDSNIKLLPGDIFLASACVSYCGPYTKIQRDILESKWIRNALNVQIPIHQDFNFIDILGDESQLIQWQQNNLPQDQVSICNGILVKYSLNYPYLIDPQQQAIFWLKKMYKKQLVYVKMEDENMLQKLEQVIINDQFIIVESVSDDNSVNPCLYNLLQKNYKKNPQNHNQLCVELPNGKVLDIHHNFKIFIFTKQTYPEITPFIFTINNVINFTVTQEGLEDQFLGHVVQSQMPEVEMEKQDLVNQIIQGKNTLKQNEEKILQQLNGNETDILDDTELVENLNNSKYASIQVNQGIQDSQIKQKEIDKARSLYADVAKRASALFFVVNDLTLIDHFYQFSLDYFTDIFVKVLQDSKKVNNKAEKSIIQQNIEEILQSFAQNVFLNISRALFNRHKKVFAFQLVIALQKDKNLFSKKELNFFLRGQQSVARNSQILQQNLPEKISNQEIIKSSPQKNKNNNKQAGQKGGINNQNSKNMSEGGLVTSEKKIEQNLKYLSMVDDIYKDLIISISNNSKEWENWYLSSNLMKNSYPWEKKLSLFQKLILVKIFREDQIFEAVDYYILQFFNNKKNTLIQDNVFTIQDVYEQSKPNTPILYILSPGSNPLEHILKCAEQNQDQNLYRRMVIISLGQGQEDIALRSLQMCKSQGFWIVLQNLQFGESILSKLDKEIEDIYMNIGTIHQNFRLFLTSISCSYVPVSILLHSLKLSDQPPQGIKTNLIKIFNKEKEEEYQNFIQQEDTKEKMGNFTKILYSLSLMHAVIQERRKFGSIGWNLDYNFNESDIDTTYQVIKDSLLDLNKVKIKVDELAIFTQEQPKEKNNKKREIPWESLQYIVGEINYGGRINDRKDNIVLQSYVKKFCNAQILENQHKFCKNGTYYQLDNDVSINEYRTMIQQLPEIDKFEIFGLYETAQTSLLLNQVEVFFETIVCMQPKIGQFNSNTEMDREILEIIEEFQEKIPSELVKVEVQKDVKDKKAIKGGKQFNKKVKEEKKDKEQQLDSLKICLLHECQKYNRLLKTIKHKLKHLKQAIKGEISMTEDLEEMYQSFYINKIPESWQKYIPQTCQPLSLWFDNFLQKYVFFNTWLQNDKPLAFWLGAFSYPQGFLTSVLQQYSRNHKISLDKLTYKFLFKNYTDKESVHKRLEEGCFIYGLHMEGCRYNSNLECLEEQFGGSAFQPSPVIQLVPIETTQDKFYEQYTNTSYDAGSNQVLSQVNQTYQFQIPLYRNSQRSSNKTSIDSTGNSLNFIIDIEVPTREPPSFWILKGVAFLCELNN